MTNSNKLRALIADDEPLARERLRMLLKDIPSIEVCGECEDGEQALAAVVSERPDILFLDIRMPVIDGLKVVANIDPRLRPAIILVTAFESYAVEAFSMQVADYLLKPFGSERLRQAVDQAAEHVRTSREARIESRIESVLAKPSLPERLVFKSGGSRTFLKPLDITWVEAANNYSILHLSDGKRLLLRLTMASLYKQLNKFGFVRINRSALAHVDQLHEVRPTSTGDYQVTLRSGTRLPLSRNLRGRFTRMVTGRSTDVSIDVDSSKFDS